MVQFRSEHNMSDLTNVDDTQQFTGAIQNGQIAETTAAEDVQHLAHLHIRINRFVVFLYNAVETHQREYSTVGVVCDEFSFTCQTHTIDAVFLKDANGEVSADRHNHQRNEQLVAAGKLSNQEDTGERSMHDTCHHARHTVQREVFLRDIDTNLMHVP